MKRACARSRTHTKIKISRTLTPARSPLRTPAHTTTCTHHHMHHVHTPPHAPHAHCCTLTPAPLHTTTCTTPPHAVA
nr:MAG TPA: hypothetical protein [Caudoviricetes sp.]